MRDIRDTQAKKVYGAEMPLRGLFGREMTVSEVEKFSKRVMGSKFVQKRWPKAGTAIEVKEITRNHQYARGGFYGIEIPPWARNTVVVLHEIAHVIVHRQYYGKRIAGHGREFCHIYLLLVRRFIGKLAMDALKLNFVSHGVKFRLPRKKRSLSPAQEAALALGRVAMRRARIEERMAAAVRS